MQPMAWLFASTLALAAAALPAAAAAGGVQAAPATGAEANSLNPVVSVRGAVIRVSDIFDGPIPRGDRAILAAPEPGERSVLDAELLSRIARAYGIAWKPASRDIRVVVKRESRLISHADVLAALRAALEAAGAPQDADIQTATASLAVSLPAEAEPRMEIGQVQYDPRTHAFAASVDITAAADGRVVFTRQVPVSGRAYATEPVPVLAATVNRGDIIQAADVTVAHVRTGLLQGGAVTDPYALVGKQARRTIKEGMPVKASQVQTPVLINRGDPVIIYYALKSMNLTAKGKALDAGGQGDVIRVLNPKSNRTLMAKVVQGNQVVVDAATQTALR
ncbi:flagellar basal body P-ring formation chaperone FlgA [Oleispirillum naphthae]|uniref:flagellar basal body P-ring formation chaperone FlgA n=1 Tax=Oleispirillum naphthae TaxID=2838853 RepID=UPI0030823AE8